MVFMKSYSKLLGIIVLLAMIGLVMVGCGEDPKDGLNAGNTNNTNNNPSTTPSPYAGRWVSNQSPNQIIIEGTTSLTATIQYYDNGSWVNFTKGTLAINGTNAALTVTDFWSDGAWAAVTEDYFYDGSPLGSENPMTGTITGSALGSILTTAIIDFVKQPNDYVYTPPNPFLGTWTASGEGGGSLVFSDTTFEFTNPGFKEKGTYTFEGNSGEITVTHIDWLDGEGYMTDPEATAGFGYTLPHTMELIITNGSINLMGTVFTKESPENAPKSITITGLDGFEGGIAALQLFTKPFSGSGVALGMNSINSNGEATINILAPNNDPWTGSGEHYLVLSIGEDVNDQNSIQSAYTAGVDMGIEDIEDWGAKISSDSLPAFNITNSNTIDFDQFEVYMSGQNPPQSLSAYAGRWVSNQMPNQIIIEGTTSLTVTMQVYLTGIWVNATKGSLEIVGTDAKLTLTDEWNPDNETWIAVTEGGVIEGTISGSDLGSTLTLPPDIDFVKQPDNFVYVP
jgi:hypothetical protein